jgi:hypothetical protein
MLSVQGKPSLADIDSLPHPNSHMTAIACHIKKVKVEFLFWNHFDCSTCSGDLRTLFCKTVKGFAF